MAAGSHVSQAISRPSLGHLSAISRPSLGHLSAISRPSLARVPAAPQPPLAPPAREDEAARLNGRCLGGDWEVSGRCQASPSGTLRPPSSYLGAAPTRSHTLRPPQCMTRLPPRSRWCTSSGRAQTMSCRRHPPRVLGGCWCSRQGRRQTCRARASAGRQGFLPEWACATLAGPLRFLDNKYSKHRDRERRGKDDKRD